MIRRDFFRLRPAMGAAIMILVACGSLLTHAGEPVFSVRSVPVGASQVDIATHDFGGSHLLLCNLHDDEDTSVEAAMQVLGRRAGKLMQLRHSGQRLVAFQLDGRDYHFDPNRIFTAKGVRRTLEDKSEWNPLAHQAVLKFGQDLISMYGIAPSDTTGPRAVVALHNNSEARYAASSYLTGQQLASDADAVYIKPGSDPDDFFFVTDRCLFDALRERQLNVVLQNNAAVTDDGSLSVYCGYQQIPYVNVEAQHGHLQQQVMMIEALFEVLEALEVIDVDTSSPCPPRLTNSQ